MRRQVSISGNIIEGILFPVYDPQLGIDKSIIAQNVTIQYGESETPVYQVTLSDEPVLGTIGTIKDDIKNTQAGVTESTYKSDVNARRGVSNLNRLADATFDTEGNYYTEKIRPLSIETKYLSVGAKSGDFLLNADIKPNYGGDFNKIDLSAGTLIHREIKWGVSSPEIDSDYVWSFSATSNYTLVDPASKYYLYVNCNKTSNSASWAISDAQYDADYNETSYMFLVGVIYPSVDTGDAHARGDSLDYGKTWINGRFITTGKVQSADQLCFFDLDANAFSLQNASGSSAIHWDRSGDGKLRIIGGVVQNSNGTESPLPVFCGAYLPSTQYYVGDTVTYLGSTWRCVTNCLNQSPQEGTYWTIEAAKGDSGDTGTTITSITEEYYLSTSKTEHTVS